MTFRDRSQVFLTPDVATLIDELEHPPVPLRLVPPVESDPLSELRGRVESLELRLEMAHRVIERLHVRLGMVEAR